MYPTTDRKLLPFVLTALTAFMALSMLVACGSRSDSPTESSEETDAGSVPERASTAASECDSAENVFERIDCFVSAASDAGDPSICGLAQEGAVAYHCFAIIAERLERRDLCDEIPGASPDHLQLRDGCISDVAAGVADGEMCREIETDGIRDGCFAKIGKATGDMSLCDEIADPGTKSMCSGEPVKVE